MKLRLHLTLALLTSFCALSLENPVFGSESSGLSTINAQRKALFVKTLSDNYSKIAPSDLKPHFKTREDIIKWLEAYYEEELSYYNTATHPINFFNIYMGGRLIGFAISEKWQGEEATLHIRQMDILPEKQHQGYGTALLQSVIRRQDFPVENVVLDTRTLNTKARNFYKVNGFEVCLACHDPELDPKAYLGLKLDVTGKTSLLNNSGAAIGA